MMNDTVYQRIFDEIYDLLPQGWKRTVIYIEYGQKYYSMAFYVGEIGNMVKCYDLPYLSEEQLYQTFARIHNFLSVERKENNETWSNMTMVVTGEHFKADFDYTDLSEGLFNYRREWKKKYL